MAVVVSRWQPSRELEIIAGTPLGGGLDRAARALAKSINANGLIDVPAKVVNVPGDGARAAWAHVDRYPRDAHLVAISSPNLTTDKLVGLANFDQNDYTPLAILYTEYMVFIVRPDSPVADAADLVRRLADDAARVTVSLSTALGNPNHIAVARVAVAASADPIAPEIRCFDTALDVVDDVIAGRTDVGVITVASIVKALSAGSVRPLAISSPARLAAPFEGVPTWQELGVDCVVGAWRGVTGPPGLDFHQIGFWDRLLSAAVGTRTWQEELAALHWAGMYLDSTSLRQRLTKEAVEYGEILTSLGLAKLPLRKARSATGGNTNEERRHTRE